jgi:hypothetical protein
MPFLSFRDMKSFQVGFSTVVGMVCGVLLCAILAAPLGGCKKDVDEEKPKVFIDLPVENSAFLTTDTIQVLCRATDNEQVKSLVIEVVDSNFMPTGNSRTYPVSGSDVLFSTPFPVNLLFNEGGTHYLVVRASDGRNQGSAFRKVLLQAVPRELEGFVVTTATTNLVRVHTGNAGFGGWTQRLETQVDFAGAAFNFRQNIYGVAGGELGNATFYETGEWSPINVLQGFGTAGLPWYAGMWFFPDPGEFLLLLNEPRLRVFDHLAQGLIGFPLQVEHRPLRAWATPERYYVLERPITQPQLSLATYARPGLLLSFLAMPGQVHGIFRRNAEEIFIWADAPGGLRLILLNEVSNLQQVIYTRPGESIRGVDQISTGVFVLSTNAGMYRYNFGNGGTFVLSSSPGLFAVRHEPVQGFFYGISGNQLVRLTPNGVPVGSFTFSQPVRAFAFDYNR